MARISDSIDSTPVRTLLIKSFIDAHDRPIKTIAVALRDAGIEVILADYEVPEDIVDIAEEEDVDVIGVSFLSGGQVEVTRKLMQVLRERKLDDIPVLVGGTIRPFDIPALKEAGVSSIFRGGEPLASIAESIRALAAIRRSS